MFPAYVTRSREMSRMSKIFNFEFLTPLSDNIKIQHFDAHPIRIGYLVTGNKQGIITENNIKQNTLSLPISQKQYRRHPTHSP